MVITNNNRRGSKPDQTTIPLTGFLRDKTASPSSSVYRHSSDVFIDCGPSPPVERVSYNFFEESADPTCEDEPKLCEHTIERNVFEDMATSNGRLQILHGLKEGKIDQENIKKVLASASFSEINVSFLWVAFLKRWELLESLIELGADLNYFEPAQGLGALHMASFSDCIPGVQFLIRKGCAVNLIFRYYAPLHCAAFGDSPEAAMILLSNGGKMEELTRDPHHQQETAVHCGVRANAVSCLRVLVENQPETFLDNFKGDSPLHLAADLGYLDCLVVLLEARHVDVNSKSKETKQTPLHLASTRGNHECVEALLKKKADASIKNHMGQTALHLATTAKSYECVYLLLSKADADPNIGDCDKRTPLHAAVGKSNTSTEIIELLISFGASINVTDQYGYTPLHVAALKGFSSCVETLISFGADISAKTKSGMTALSIMTKKCPATFAMFMKKLDSAINLNHPESSRHEVELRLDFRVILQYCHPREIIFLNTLVEEGYKKVLKHPLCSALLHLKWRKIRKYYMARIIFSLIFMLCLSLYVLTALARNCYNFGKNSKQKLEPIQFKNYDESLIPELCEKGSIIGRLLRTNPFVIEMQWFVLVGITCCEILRKVYGIKGYHSLKQYFSYPENLIEWAVIASVFVISFIYTGRTYTWQNHIGAFAVLLGWTNLMLMVGQLPSFGSYVAMYTRVQSEFAKLLLAYSGLLIGFTLSFCVIFPDSSLFANPFISLITTMVMMSGELNLDILVDDNPDHYLLDFSAQVVYVVFVLTVTIILMNLLVGIAVDDIKGLQKTARISKLVRQTKLISHIELALFSGNVPRYLLNVLHWTALVSPKPSKVILNLKPLNPKERRLPRDIMRAAFDIARKKRSQGDEHIDLDFKWNNHTDDNMNDLGDNVAFEAIMERIDRRNEEIDCLTREVIEIKKSILEGQEQIEKVLFTILRNRRGSKC